MTTDSSILDKIYEAAVLPEFWPKVIEQIAEDTGCYGGAFFSAGTNGTMLIASKTCEPHLHALMENGWADRNIRAQRLLSLARIGFVTDHDLCSEDEIANHPIYTDFLRPRGLGWSIATHIAGAHDDIAIFSIDQRFDRGPVSQRVRQSLNEMRPHIARAAMLAAQFQMERVRGSLISLDQLGIPAVAVDRRGKARMTNDCFSDAPSKVRVGAFDLFEILDERPKNLFHQALSTLNANDAPRSIPVAGTDEEFPFVIHIIPVRRNVRDIFTGVDAIVAIVPLNFPNLAFRDLAKKLYDFTETEAKIVQALVSGSTVKAIAERNGGSPETVRSHLKNIFAKTGVGRQADLILLFAASKPPTSP